MRTRFFSLISYCPEDFILSVCKQRSLYYAFILHDKDVKEDGSLVIPHYHILLKTEFTHTKSAVVKWFKHEQNTFSEEVYSTSIFDYLTHTGFEDKYQYQEEDIISNNIDMFKNHIETGHDVTISLLDDIIANKSMRYMASKYGRDYVLNFRKYNLYAQLMFYQEQDDVQLNNVANIDAETGEIINESLMRESAYTKEDLDRICNCSVERSD